MRYYCTYFDINFASRALVLFKSLKQYEKEFLLYALCLDNQAYEAVQRVNDPQLLPININELEENDPRLPIARSNRSQIEYYFTLSPFLPLHIFNRNPDVSLLTYVDADCCYYHSPQSIYDEMGANSVLIIEHRFAPPDTDKLKWGRYNVGLLVFRNDDDGRRCLEQWATQCADWCHDRLENGKFADQKYLDEWPATCRGVHVLQHKGVNLAPWNTANFKLHNHAGVLWVNDFPLIMFHFHGLRLVSPDKFCPTLDDIGITPDHVRFLYMPYIQSLRKASTAHNIPLGGYSRKSRLSPSDSEIALVVTPLKLPSPFWLAGYRWHVMQTRRTRMNAFYDIIVSFHSRDWVVCAKRLRKGLFNHPLLLLNRHVWNVLFHCFLSLKKTDHA